MGDYFVTYKGNEQVGVNVYYTIEYFTANPETGKKEKAFELRPLVQLNERMGNVAEPATKHYWNRDIYTHITFAELEDKKSESSDEYQAPKEHQLAIGDTVVTSNSFVILDGLDKNIRVDSLHLGPGDIAISARLRVEDINRKLYEAAPVFLIRDYSIYSLDDTVDALGLKFTFEKIDPETGKITLAVSEKKNNKKNFIIMKAIIFPGINILWIGCLLMILGSVMAIVRRIKKSRAGSKGKNALQ